MSDIEKLIGRIDSLISTIERDRRRPSGSSTGSGGGGFGGFNRRRGGFGQGSLAATLAGKIKDLGIGSAQQAGEAITAQEASAQLFDIGKFSQFLDPITQALNSINALGQSNAASFKNFGQSIQDVFGEETSALIKSVNEEGLKLGLTFEQSQEQLAKLSTEFGGFINLNQEGQTQIFRASVAMQTLGFSSRDAAGIFDTATRSFGMNADQTIRLASHISELRTELNLSAQEISQNFLSAQDKLAYNSGKLIEVFTKLQTTSRITGIDFNTLTNNFGESFDTFEGSAKKVGQLNALLGTSVFDSLDMLGKNEGERLETIVSGIRDNVNVNALIQDKFQLKAVAKQLGLSPGQTRRLLLGETTMSKAMEERVKSAETIKVENANIALNKFETSVLEAIGPIGAATISQIKSLDLLNSTSKLIADLGEKFGILEKGEIGAIEAGSLPEGLTSFISRTVGIAKKERGAKEILKDPQGFKANITPAGMANISDALQEFSDKLLEVTDGELNFKELPNLVQAGISLKLMGGIPGMALITPALEAVSRNKEFKEEIGKGIKLIKDFFNPEKKKDDDDDDDGDARVTRPGEMTVVTLAPGTKLEITGYSKITDTVIAQVT